MTTRDGLGRLEPVFTPPDPDGDVEVTCWCELAVVRVPVAEVRALRTRSCGLSGCRP